MSATKEVPFVPPETSAEQPKMLLWRILVEPYKPPETTEGGIILSEDVIKTSTMLSTIGRIIDMGDLAFREKTKSGLALNEDGNLPEEGDWILFSSQAGRRVYLRDGREFVILNDDEILGVIGNPSLYKQWI